VPEHIRRFYREQAARYEQLVARQDHRGNLFAAICELVLPSTLEDMVAVEFGAGTGNLSLLLSVLLKRHHAFDIEPAMLQRAAALLEQSGMRNVWLAVGENAHMPVLSNCADMVIEGWSFNHVLDFYPQSWQQQIDRMLAQMARILKPGGIAILIEDLGIGQRRPQAPSPSHAQLYAYWQDEHGFARRWIRSDYAFASAAEAQELAGFFFGDTITQAQLSGESLLLPECSGIWWRRY